MLWALCQIFSSLQYENWHFIRKEIRTFPLLLFEDKNVQIKSHASYESFYFDSSYKMLMSLRIETHRTTIITKKKETIGQIIVSSKSFRREFIDKGKYVSEKQKLICIYFRIIEILNENIVLFFYSFSSR